MLQSLFNESYWISRFLIHRAIGLIYLIAFINALNQFIPLAGERGLTPIDRFLKMVSFKRAPSIFHGYYSDSFLRIIAWIGIAGSLVAVSGLSEMGPFWFSMLIWFVLWALYLSIVNVGQTFYGFGWESMLLEIGFYSIFLGPMHWATPVAVIWIIRWMLFRVEFGAGLIKMRGDQCWRDLTCLNYHHETQPLPNPLSWYFHQMPKSLHRVETFFNHLTQLGIIWFIFTPQPIASIASLLIMLSQSYLIISGNYSWLNWMTIFLTFSGFSDGIFAKLFSISPPAFQAIPLYYQIIVIILLITILIMSIQPVKNLVSPRQMMNFSFNPVHLVNTYGAFGSVTKKRFEIIIEGTWDKNIDATTQWKAYEFKGKPCDPNRRPPQVAPYHLRLDWQMWFAAMTTWNRHPWFPRLIRRLLEGDPQILELLKENPFEEKPPTYIRARLYRYRYTTLEERKETGQWWKRSYVQEYFCPHSLEAFG